MCQGLHDRGKERLERAKLLICMWNTSGSPPPGSQVLREQFRAELAYTAKNLEKPTAMICSVGGFYLFVYREER